MIIEIAFWATVVLIFYIYAGYYFISLVLNKIAKKSPLPPLEEYPEITMVISAFNEEDVIKEKLKNTVALDYPVDKLKIAVISDASEDKTDEIVNSFPDERVKLYRMPERKGKTFGINTVIKQLSTPLVVFSDANAIYETDAIKELVKYFADPKTGYVVGNAQYYKDEISSAGKNEDAYWSIEIALKIYESQIGSVVGGDGAIYAIRRALFWDLAEEDINDFVNPLNIIRQGYRGRFNPKAICYEHTADTFEKEFSRKRRIVNRSWRGLMKNLAVLNPFKSGIHAWQVFSHKMLRWLGGIFFLVLLLLNFALLENHPIYQFLMFGHISIYLWAILGAFIAKSKLKLPTILTIPYYFMRVNIASILGIIDNMAGKKYSTWQTIRN